MQVIKRDGRPVDFDIKKIVLALRKAFNEVDGSITKSTRKIIHNIANEISEIKTDMLSVEEIQDIIEQKLMQSSRKDVAKAYIIYRNERTKVRDRNNKLVQAVMDRVNVRVDNHSNANVDEKSFSGREKEAATDIGKIIALDFDGLSEEVAQAHKEMLIYQHDLEKAIYGIHNCLGENTKIITTKGVKTFAELNNGDEIFVVTHSGKIQRAIVKCYGQRPVYDFTFKRFKTVHHILATDNHRWLLKDGTWTDNIKVGDYLAHAPNIYEEFDYEKLSLDEKKYWCYGFVMGDGTVRYKYSKMNKEYLKADDSKVRLCGKKTFYKNRFAECGFKISTQKIENGDIYIEGIDFNKVLPDVDKISYIQLCSFIHGLYDADGGRTNFSASGAMMYTIQFTGKEICDFVDKYFECAGLYISRRKDKTNQKTNFGVRDYTIEYNFIPNPHRFNYQLIDMNYVGIENVWCLEVDNDNSFILDGGIVTGNCLNLNFQEIFTYGFRTRNGDVRPPKSYSTACQLYAVAFQCQSQVQFGGVGSIHTDIDLAPFVKMSFYKHYADGCKYIGHLDKENIDKIIAFAKANELSIDDDYFKEDSDIYEYSMDMLEKEGQQSTQALYHNLNTLESRQGSQVPFTSINLGRDTTVEGRKIIKWVMEASIDGIGEHHLTSIFPISIFQYKQGANANPEDKNYDMKRLALESMSKRIYPNWCNCDWSQAHEDENNPDTFFATMGAIAGHEHLYIKCNDDKPIDISIKELFEMLKNKETIKGRAMQPYYNSSPLNIPTDKNWRKVQCRDDSGIKAEAGVYKITYVPQDISYIGSSEDIQRRIREHKKDIRHIGGLDCGLYFADEDINNYSFEVIEYTDDYVSAEKKYIQTIPNANFKGISSKYYKNVGLSRRRGYDVRPKIKMNPNIPQDFICLEDLDIKVLDKDNKWVKVKHIFKNDKMNTPLMMYISYMEYDKVYTLCCTEDHPLWNGEKFVRADCLKRGDNLYRADELPLPIVEVKYHTERIDSYDIGTETGSFIGSDIIMHNCRTMIGYDRNGLGYIRQGRGNNVPNTIILPKLGIEYGTCLGERQKPDLDGFWQAFEETLKLTEKGLLERFAIMVEQSPKSAPFMYNNNTIQDACVCKEDVFNALKHNTLAIGYIGIAEMCQALFGKNHVHDEKVHDFALSVVKRIYDYAIEASERNNLNFSCYATPAESLCRTALMGLREQYGIIPDVTSHDYLTNSHHVPVWEKVSIYKKLECEAPFCKYPTGGNITYVELDSTFVKNIDAVETIIDYAFKTLDIPYLAFNFPIDSCMDCGYQGEFNCKCPECGSTNIQQLRRVTGYLTTDWHNFNDGKQAEVQDRVKHSSYTETKGGNE